MSAAVFDHVAIGTGTLTEGWQLFGGLLGGSWAYGGDSPGFWWGQLRFRSGPKIELLTPTGGPDAAFLERFLADRGPGPHHLNFAVPDITDTLARARAAGIDAVGVDLSSPTWKEAFLHPRDAYGIVIQVAQQSGPPPQLAPPADLPEPGPAAGLDVIEHHVTDLNGAVTLYTEVLDGQVVSQGRHGGALAAELMWQDGACLRLVQVEAGSAGLPARTSGRLARLHFSYDAAPVAAELSRADALSRRLGTAVQLS